MEGLPLASRPKHVPDSVGDCSVGHSRPAAPLVALVALFGQVLLEFPPQRSWKAEIVHFTLCGSLSHKAHPLWERLLFWQAHSLRDAPLFKVHPEVLG